MNNSNAFNEFINWWAAQNNVPNTNNSVPVAQPESGIPMYVVYALMGLVAFILILALLFNIKNKTT